MWWLLVLACTADDGRGDDDDGGGITSAADVLFVIDNSPSMVDEAASLAFALDGFLGGLVDAGVTYNVGVTTTTVDDAGSAGALVDDLVTPSVDSPVDELRGQILCRATAWDAVDVPSDPGFVCGDDPDGVVTLEYLDCLCGTAGWGGHTGSGDEEPLEATLLAMCRAADEPPEVCYDPLTPFTEDDEGSNAGLLRERGAHLVIVVSDEGDNSRRLAQGEESPEPYESLFASFGLTFSAMGPNWDPDTGDIECATTSVPTWSVERVHALTVATGGVYAPIAVDDGSGCVAGDVAGFLAEVVP